MELTADSFMHAMIDILILIEWRLELQSFSEEGLVEEFGRWLNSAADTLAATLSLYTLALDSKVGVVRQISLVERKLPAWHYFRFQVFIQVR